MSVLPGLILGLTSTIIGCAAPVGSADGMGAGVRLGPKADGIDTACRAAHNEWLTSEFAPLECVEGPARCVGRVAVDTRPPCEGEADYETWSLVWEKHVFGPWMLRRNEALTAFTLASSPHFDDRARYIEIAAATPDEMAAHLALLEVPRVGEVLDYQMWQDRYATQLMDFATPLYSQSSLSTAEDGRGVCGGPFLFDPATCSHEPALYLNSSERQMLSAFEDVRPVVPGDGAFASWAETYFEFLAGSTTEDSFGFAFPRYSNEGLAFYELDFFEGLAGLRPAVAGDADAGAWVTGYRVLLSGADLADSDQVLQVDLFEETRPPQLFGVSAYTSWLGSDVVGLGFAFDSSDAGKLERLLAAKPCARDVVELAELGQVFEAFDPEFETADLALAAPALCSAPP